MVVHDEMLTLTMVEIEVQEVEMYQEETVDYQLDEEVQVLLLDDE